MAQSNSSREHVSALVEQLLSECPPSTTDAVEFLGRQFDLGLAWVHFPEGRGGLGLEPGLQELIDVPLERAAAPAPMWLNPIGVGMGAPTLLAYATDEQVDRLLRPLFTSEERWCQLFSEPGAGSDLAGLATRAVREDAGGDWRGGGEEGGDPPAHPAPPGPLLAPPHPGQAPQPPTPHLAPYHTHP